MLGFIGVGFRDENNNTWPRHGSICIWSRAWFRIGVLMIKVRVQGLEIRVKG